MSQTDLMRPVFWIFYALGVVNALYLNWANHERGRYVWSSLFWPWHAIAAGVTWLFVWPEARAARRAAIRLVIAVGVMWLLVWLWKGRAGR